ASAWLHTSGNHILHSDGRTWHGRGANLHDTRSCDACTSEPPSVAEVERRIDELVDVWKANFIRLDRESYASSSGRMQWQTVLADPGYLATIGGRHPRGRRRSTRAAPQRPGAGNATLGSTA